MYISYNWLNDYIDLSEINPEEVASQLTLCSAEVEHGAYVGAHYTQVKAARIDKIEPHPNADRLMLATVFDGTESSKVVCGALNIEEGQVVPYAPLGTVLPGDFEIKPAKIRGVESCGMLCSEKELGLGDSHEGILQLDKDTKPGTFMTEFFGEKDYIIEIENKTINHRPDLWGHYGISRELKTIFKKEWKKELQAKDVVCDKEEEKFTIDIISDKALYYLGLKMSNISIVQSPDWIKTRLNNVGIRPINNIVDITNYVMLETGHPMHAFDRRDISGNKIIVKMAKEGETFNTLDGEKRTLSNDDIVIADENRSLALGGVMGGENSEVKDDTTEIFLEAALFDPITVRRTANRHDLRTDSSSRFEKALWKENAHLAITRFVELVKQIIPEAVVSSKPVIADNSEGYGFEGAVSIKPDKIRNVIGLSADLMPDERIKEILESLEFSVNDSKDLWEITVPDHRRSKDVSIDADIIEEVGRIYGFNNIPAQAPKFPMAPAVKNIIRQKEEQLRLLISKQFNAAEIMTYSFMSEKDKACIPYNEEKIATLVDVKETPYMRYSMAPGMLAKVHENMKNFNEFTLFEFGRAFSNEAEDRRLSIAHVGDEDPLFRMKEIVVAIIEELKIPNYRLERILQNEYMFAKDIMHPERSAILSTLKWKAGIFGEIHPKMAKHYGLKKRVGYIELNVDQLYDMPKQSTKFTHLFKLPSTFFEFSMVVPIRTEADTLLNIIRKAVDKKLLVEHKIVDQYIGDPIPAGMQSLSFRVVLNAGDRTLTNDEMKAVQDKVIKELRNKGFKLKGDE